MIPLAFTLYSPSTLWLRPLPFRLGKRDCSGDGRVKNLGQHPGSGSPTSFVCASFQKLGSCFVGDFITYCSPSLSLHRDNALFFFVAPRAIPWAQGSVLVRSRIAAGLPGSYPSRRVGTSFSDLWNTGRVQLRVWVRACPGGCRSWF